MKIYCFDTKKEAGAAAALTIAGYINDKSDAVLGLATGSSPLDMYASLVSMCSAGKISFKSVKTVNLDEYRGLAPEHPQSYAHFMRENLFDKIDIDLSETNIPNGLADDPDAECIRYNKIIEFLGGIDIQVLGIGHNGHIGFNEPADSYACGTSLVKLARSTVRANARFFESEADVPTEAFSMGIDQILKAQKIILLASGDDKALILERALFGAVSPEVPASALRLAKDVEIYADREALSVIIDKHKDSVEFK